MTIEITTSKFTTVTPLDNLRLIVASDLKGTIGKDNALPWKSIKGDLPRFKLLTTGATLIMGRKSFESLPGLLPGRDHYVITRDAKSLRRKYHDNPQVHFFHSIEGAISAVRRQPDSTFFVAGGAEIYHQMLPYCSIIYHTLLWDNVDGDTVYKEVLPGSPIRPYFRTLVETFVLDSEANLSHGYITYLRRRCGYDSYMKRHKLKRSIKRIDKLFTES